MEPWQIRASVFHPYLIASLDELPDGLRPSVEAALPPGTKLASGLVVPANYRSKTPDAEPEMIPAQALIFTGEGMWHIQAPTVDQPAPAPIYIQPDNIRWIRSSHLLLYGRLEIASAFQGEPVLLDIEFNAVGWRQKDQNWRNLVAQAVGMPPIQAGVMPAPGDRDRALLSETPEKFVDGLFRYGLYTGETLLAATFQPAVWQHHLIAFDEQRTPDTLLALTNASVLILSEEKALVRHSDDLGMLITRIPRQAIVELQVEKGDLTDTVVFSLERGGVADAYRLSLAPDAAQAWLDIWETR
ncbi:MAG: hypothetical protein NZ553_13180 [Caldilinea sp.]|nr:hypothetical protein [Caldilinea sp.]MDW8441423.1 hypothetical protein [Caldilineaceae bacterium]